MTGAFLRPARPSLLHASALAVLLVLLAPAGTFGCEPIVPLLYVHGGPAIAFGMLGMTALAIAVGLKSAVFAAFSPELGRPRAFVLMIVANVVTTIAGLLAILIYAVPGVGLAIPITGLMATISLAPARRLAEASYLPARFRSRPLMMVLLFVAWLGGLLLFGLSRSLLDGYERAPLESGPTLAAYWLAKFGFVFVGVAMSMFFTTIWEEWLVAIMAKSPRVGRDHYRAAVRANVATFLAGWLVAAAAMLPARLGAPDFLAWLAGVGSGGF